MSLDDYAANINTTGNLGSFLGTNYLDTSFSIEGNIDNIRDNDLFAVTLSKGNTYKFSQQGINRLQAISYTYIKGIYDTSGTIFLS